MTASVELRAVLRDEITAALKNIQVTTKQAGDAAQSAGRSLGVLEDETEKLSASIQDNIIKLRAQRDLLKDPAYQASAKQAAALKKEIDELNAGLKTGTRENESNAMSWAGLVSKYYLAAQAIGTVKNATMSLVEASSKYELLQARLASVEGSSALGMRDFKEVQELAKKPGLGFEEAASTFATLRGMKVTAAEAKTLINGIAQANASAAGTAEQFGRVMYQIQQSVSLGRLMAEDLRPIQQAIPTLGAAMQEHFGAAQAEQLNKILEKSGKSVRDFWLEVAELGSKLPSTGETIANNLDNMGDAWTRFKASLSNSGVIRSVTGYLADLLNKLAEAQEKIDAEGRSKKSAEKELGIEKPGAFSLAGMASQAKYQILTSVGLDPDAGKRSLYQTSVGGAIGEDEAVARMRVTQNLRDDLQARLKLQQEANDREIAENKRKAEKKTEDDAAAAKKAGESLKSQLARHDKASAANVIFSGANEVTMRDSGELDPEHVRNRQRAEEARETREKAALEDRLREEKRVADERKREQEKYTRLIHDENQKRLNFERQYWQQVQSSATNAINGIAQTLIMGGGSMKDKLRQILTQGESALISGGINMLMGAAFAPATGGASMAMPGALGVLQSFMGMRANGGAALGPVVVGDGGRPEVWRPATPGTVYNQSSQHYNYSGPITVVVSGANADEVARGLPRAITAAQRNRRQNSISQ